MSAVNTIEGKQVNYVPPRVLIVTFGPQPPLGESLAAGFERLGSTAQIFHSWQCNNPFDRYVINPINHYAKVLRLMPKSGNLFEGHPKSHKEWRSRGLINLCRQLQPELVIITGIQRFKEEVLRELHERCTVFFWFTESEERFHEVANELPYYHQVYFLSSSGVDKARELGVPRVDFLQHAVDPAQFHPLDLPKKYDWCFVGQWNKRRQHYVEGLAEVSRNFVIYGPRWRKHTYLKPTLWWRVKGREIWGEQLTRLYNQTRVVINVSVWGNEDRGGYGVNQRLLEVPACRACLLSDYARDAEMLLVPGKEFASASNLTDMKSKLRELLINEHQRQEIADNGFQKASKIRTYDHLVTQFCSDWAKIRGFS
jgi:spore maturation protein CgeB